MRLVTLPASPLLRPASLATAPESLPFPIPGPQQLIAEEEEAASRGWGWRRPVVDLGLGLGLPSASLSGKLLPLPELAAAVCACPSRSYVLGRSGAIYSARWHGRNASLGPSMSPWTSWVPPTGGQRGECSQIEPTPRRTHASATRQRHQLAPQATPTRSTR